MKLNLEEIGWPVCLMKFKSALNGIDPQEVLEVRTKDPNIAENIVMIADNSQCEIIRQNKRDSFYRIYIQKRP